MDRPALDRFTRDIWKRFDRRDLEPLKAILRLRAELAGTSTSPVPRGIAWRRHPGRRSFIAHFTRMGHGST